MEYKITFNGQETTVEFTPDEKIQMFEEVHLEPYKYGALDLIKKDEENPDGKVIIQNGIFSFMKYPGKEAYIVDCRDYKKICNITEIKEIRRSPVKN